MLADCWKVSFNSFSSPFTVRRAGKRLVKSERPSLGRRCLYRGSVSPENFRVISPPGKMELDGAVVALGKFDALHLGHQSLAVAASQMGSPWLLSFSGMPEVLGWEPRLPLVAPCDRARVFRLWSSSCQGMVPQEHSLDFRAVRTLSPEDFVNHLATQMKVKGVVAGDNYRFGYRASGDALQLSRLCRKFGLLSHIVSPVLEDTSAGLVSSTQVRELLKSGDMHRIAKLLGRRYRICFELKFEMVRELVNGQCEISIEKVLLENEGPGNGNYDANVFLQSLTGSGNVGDDTFLGDATVAVDDKRIFIHRLKIDRKLFCETNCIFSLDLKDKF